VSKSYNHPHAVHISESLITNEGADDFIIPVLALGEFEEVILF
jgi:hypothetical protein